MSDLIRATALTFYVEHAAANRLNGLEQIRLVGLPETAISQPDTYIPYSKLIALLENSANASGNEFFGLELGLQQGITTLGALTYLIRNCATVREALDSFTRYLRVHTGGGQTQLVISDGCAMLNYRLSEGQSTGIRQIIEYTFAVGVCLLRALCGENWRPQRIVLQTAPGKQLSTYRRLLGVVPQFNDVDNALVFASHWLEHPLSGADPELRRLMQQEIQRLDNLYQDELPAHVIHLIRGTLRDGEATMNRVARRLGMSSRSLQRFLAAEGTSFHKLLDDTRRSLAEQYLRDSDLQVAQLASVLGYTAHSTFTRAFRRWFSCSPFQWKQINRTKGRRRIPQHQRL